MGRTGKPIDLGNGTICASFDASSAAWLSIGTTHSQHGFVELSGLPPFDEALRGDPDAARRYRAAMTRATHAFLTIQIGGRRPRLRASTVEPQRPSWSGEGIEVRASMAADGRLRQTWSFAGGSGPVTVRVEGRLDRPALAEITELDPPEPTGATSTMAANGPSLTVVAAALPSSVTITLAGRHVAWTTSNGKAVGRVASDAAAAIELDILATFGGDAPPSLPAPDPARDHLTERALTYVRGCTALGVGHDERAILTDHRILPLSWTRDAYWQALALLAADGAGDRARVADHLRWLWRRCERPDGRWVRSHHANGRRKDLAFQADQQLYPLIELADYWRVVGDLPGGVDWDTAIRTAWEAALAAVDHGIGLIASAETAADDPADAPFIGAAQVLLWYAARRLVEVAEHTHAGPQPSELAEVAAVAADAFGRHHAATQPWAYAVDAAGARVAYHDANDLPIALAPLWGFCMADDPGWRATVEFAFSPLNPAWCPGRRAGLGSAHTPGAWTLGDLQAWIVGHTIDDSVGAARALARLDEVAFADGMLPEAYGADGGEPVRHWFAWPGAALAALRLLAADGRLEVFLRAPHR